MKLWKSLVFGFVTYVVLTFLANIAILAISGTLSVYFTLDILTIITHAFTGIEGFSFVSVEIYGGMSYAVSPLGFPNGDYLGSIGAILVPIIPGLAAAIVAGIVGKSAKNGFFGMLITGVLVSIMPIVLVWVNNLLFDATVPLVSLILNNPYLEATFTGVIGIFIGLFWGGIAAIIGSRYD